MTRHAPVPAILVLCAALASCGSTTTSSADRLTLQGTAAGVSFPDAVVYLASGDATHTGVTGQLTAPGTFRLDVGTPPPAADAFDLLTVPDGCTVSGAAQNHPKVQFYDRLVVASPEGDPLGHIRELVKAGGTLPFSRVARVYSDRAATVQATIRCGGTTEVNYDVTLRRGWNAVEFSDAQTVSMKSLGTVTTAFESSLNLPYISVVLAPELLTFRDNATAQVAATLYQEGGLGGTFTLKTDIEGLTVTPSEVTLGGPLSVGPRPGSGLRRLGLGTQALRTTLAFTYTGAVNGVRPFVITVTNESGQQVGRGDGTLDVQRP
ncbi:MULTISPECIES: hypothetical protein [Deinococcus]|uniref:DUF4382 domain-containing protein n=1 Tax=Deinococcus rufus TaxID=2136097 RepID=A0ABV7ZC27_9DEIO|nr:hypothetical protein [Deinococcus sp. AB2017081]WQE93927.1 hypothetical protein U2P90_10960 [Deinococcus sp. AB2017081]